MISELMQGESQPSPNKDFVPTRILINPFSNSCPIIFTFSLLLILKINSLNPVSFKGVVFKEFFLLCNNSFIFFPPGKLIDSNLMTKYEIIRNIAINNNCKVIELANIINYDNAHTYLGDSVHPNKAGMEKMAEEVIRVIKEDYQ